MSAWLAAGFAAWLAAAAAYHLSAQASLRRLLQRTAPPHGPLPSSAILRPANDDAPVHEGDLATLCAQGARVLLGVATEHSVAAVTARKAAQGGKLPQLEIVRTPPGRGANRKVGKLIAMVARVTHEEIAVFIDGDVAVPASYLDAVLAPFADAGVGMVTCPYRSLGGGSLPARIDVILTNAGFLPSVALGARIEGVRFALGATIAVRRRVLDEIGGLEPLRDVLADDWAIAERVCAAGHRIELAPLLLDHRVDDAGWRAVLQRHVRWARTIRVVRPAGYAGTIVAHGFIPACVLAGLLPPAAAWAVVAGYAAARIGSALQNAARVGLTAKDLALLPFADFVAIGIYVAGLAGRTVRWSGSALVLRSDGTVRAAAE